jgi:phenylacetate-CoA ligase
LLSAENGGLNILSYIDHTIGAYLRRYVVFPLYWKYTRRSNVLKYYQELRTCQWNTWEENKKIQQKKLYKLIQYASQNIPYYQKVIQEHQISFSEDTIFADLKKFPLLTKEIIRNNFDKLFKFRDNTYYRNSSGGSMGEPLIFYQDSNYFAWNTAAKIFFDEWAGRKIGEPIVKLWGSLRDVLKGGQGFTGYLRQQLSGVIILPSYKMTEKDMYRYVHRINKIKPRLILAYLSSIDELARFIQDHHLSVYSPYAIMTSASALYPEVRVRIEKIFQAPVFNRYGSMEVGDMACNCEKNHSLHLIPSVHFLEIMDDKGKEVSQEELGEIIVTLLTNYTMPLIRYKIGDWGSFSLEKECSCGRRLPLLKKVEGYISSVLRNKKGDLIDSGFFFHLFFFRDYIKQFQVIQESMENITINLILKDKEYIKIAEKDFIPISQAIKKVMGSDTIIIYKLVDVIEPSPSGKYLAVLSKVED